VSPDDLKEGSFTVDAKGNVKQRRKGILVDPDYSQMGMTKAVKKKRLWAKKNAPQIKALINLREATKDVLRIQQETDEDEPLKVAQTKMGKLYDQYVSDYGLIRDTKAKQLFRTDPQYPLLLALENFDPEQKTATKADIFTKRTLAPYRPLTTVSEDPRESLLQVLGETGRADIDLISTLSEKPREQIIEELEERNLIFENPDTGEIEISEQYLSGYVVEKLKIAERAAETDPRFQRNVDALAKAQPKRIMINGPDLKKLISVRLGSTWIPIDALKDFIRHLDNSPGRIIVTYKRQGQRGDPKKGAKVKVGNTPKEWTVVFPHRRSVANTRRWGTSGMEGQKLLQIALNQQRPKVYFTDTDGTRHIDRDATLAAKAKMDEIKNEFEKWAREDEKWSGTLEQAYNDT
jgi:N12 class adenine-specific DNA methylase